MGKYGVREGVGISLSPFQIAKANDYTVAANLTSSLRYQVADAMNMPFDDDSFDLSKLDYSSGATFVAGQISRCLRLCSNFCTAACRAFRSKAWSMESGEHMPNKESFMKELYRVTAPGGRILIVTWCHRELRPGEADITPKEKRLLDKINKGLMTEAYTTHR